MKPLFRSIIFLVLLLFVSTMAHAQVAPMFYTTLRQELKYRIGENTPNMTDALYDSCVQIASQAMRTHGLAGYKETTFRNLPANTNHFAVKNAAGTAPIPLLFIDALSVCPDVTALGPVEERALPEIQIKDVGRKQLGTDAPHSFFFQYSRQDTPYVFIYPSKADGDSIVFGYFGSFDAVSNSVYLNPVYREALLNYASMWVWLRLENWTKAAEAYNAYQREINIVRQERVNWVPDVTISPELME
jgi:hypothetical protein